MKVVLNDAGKKQFEMTHLEALGITILAVGLELLAAHIFSVKIADPIINSIITFVKGSHSTFMSNIIPSFLI